MAEQGQLGAEQGKVGAALAGLRQRWAAMPTAQRRILVLSVLAIAVLGGIGSWWSSRTDWRTLFNGLEARDAAQVQQQLSAAGITFQTTPDGTALQVPAEELDKARVAIAAKGMPQSGRLGFELFDKPNWVGSEFDERVNYQRALEGELEHTIETMEAIRSARVHVVLPKQGAFSSEDQPAKASVVLKLRRSNVPREEAESIRTMIASAVEGLQAGAVTLVDADGRVDLSGKPNGGTQRDEEAALEAKLIHVLEPLAGAGNVHATVNLSYLTGSEEHTDEVYDPTGSAPVSLQKNDQTAQTVKAGGIAGTASNTPAAVAVSNTPTAPGAVPAPAAATPPSQVQSSHEESSSYAVTRHVTHTEEGPGRVRRIAAAVVINDRMLTDANAKQPKTVWKPRTSDEMKRMEQLAQAAVGFETRRGDSVVLENLSFSTNTEDKAPAMIDRMGSQVKDLLRAQPSLLRTLGMGMCLLLLGFLVLRPLVKQTARLMEPLRLPAPLAAGAAAPTPLEASLLPSGKEAYTPVSLPPMGLPSSDAQTVFDRVTDHIKTEPAASARLMQAWISGNEESD